jgi:prophage tail gpP-like protein
MSLSRPHARIAVDGTELGADEAALLRLRVVLASDGRHDHAELLLWPRSKFADAKPGAALTIALGERGDEETVWTGEVSARRQQPQAIALEGLAATVALSRAATSQSYRDQTVADIVRDLAGAVAVDKAEGDLKLHAYHVDNRRPVWSHLRALARLVGADLGSAPDGGLRFLPAAGAVTPVALRYGAELLDWRITQQAAPQAAAVAAAGAASEQGDARWHWLAHDPVGAEGGATRLPAALSTRDGAQAVGQALAQRAQRAGYAGDVLIAGRPALRPGDAVELQDLPGGSPGVLRVRSVVHSFDARSGFLTRLQVEGGEGGGGLPGGLS